MSNKFRNQLLDEQSALGKKIHELLTNGEIHEFDDELWNIITRDKTSIRLNGDLLAFKDLFHQDLNEGRCKNCVFEFLFLLDKLGIYSEAVKCVNEGFIGTSGSSYGGHWYLEIHVNDNIKCIDTSLVITGTPESFSKLGHQIIRKYDIDTIFKENPDLIDYYDSMIVNKTNL